MGGFATLMDSGISSEGSSAGQAVESPLKGREALIVTCTLLLGAGGESAAGGTGQV